MGKGGQVLGRQAGLIEAPRAIFRHARYANDVNHRDSTLAAVYRWLLSGKPDIGADMTPRPFWTQPGRRPKKGVYRAGTPQLGEWDAPAIASSVQNNSGLFIRLAAAPMAG